MGKSEARFRACYIIGFALALSSMVCLLSLPCCWGYRIASDVFESTAALLVLVLSLGFFFGFQALSHGSGRFAIGSKEYVALFVCATAVFSAAHAVSVVTRGSVCLPMGVNVVLFSLVLT